MDGWIDAGRDAQANCCSEGTWGGCSGSQGAQWIHVRVVTGGFQGRRRFLASENPFDGVGVGRFATLGLGVGDFVYRIIVLFVSVVSCMGSKYHGSLE